MAIKGDVTLEDVRVTWTDRLAGKELAVGDLWVEVSEENPHPGAAGGRRWAGVFSGREFFMQLGIALSWDGEVPDAAEAWKAADTFETVTGIRLAP